MPANIAAPIYTLFACLTQLFAYYLFRLIHRFARHLFGKQRYGKQQDMEKALIVQRGKERLVSAIEMQLELHGRDPYGVRFICPLCRQPLFPAAMSPKSKQSPHFRHARNNTKARECELFASSHGYYSTYQRMPMPMFIRKSRSRNGAYTIEGGFRSLDKRKLEKLEHEGAVLIIGQKKYRITFQRFGAGLIKLPFEEVSLNCGSAVRLVDSSLDLYSTWGYPEDAHRAMVFARDAITDQGKRVKLGDSVPIETDLFLLAPERESSSIRSAFTNVCRVGTAGNRMSTSSLSVFTVRLTKDDDRWKLGQKYLEECGFTIKDSGDTPELIWPPSMVSNGDILPLFQRTRCVFTADMNSPEDTCLYVHTNADTAGQVKTVPLRKSNGKEKGFAILKNAAKLSFVTTRNWVFSTAALLHPSDFDANEWLHGLNLAPRVSFDSGHWVLELACPDEILGYSRGKGVQPLKLMEGETSLSFEGDVPDMVRVRRKLSASLDYLTIFEKTFGSHCAPEEAMTAISERNKLAPGISEDAAFAVARFNGSLRHRGGADIQRAVRRKAEASHEQLR